MRIHNLGFPRMGANRELKFALESYWKQEISQENLLATAAELRQQNWQKQQQVGLDLIPVGDFALYDHVLNTSILVGNIPPRFHSSQTISELNQYFRMARGRAPEGEATFAGEMTKWFDTNYHYIVPELSSNTQFQLNAQSLLIEIQEALLLNINAKPVLLGPLSYLYLGKIKGESFDRLQLLPSLLSVYSELLQQLKQLGVEWVQIDEPILVLELDPAWQQAFEHSYQTLSQTPSPKRLLTTYFGQLGEQLALVKRLPIEGLHIDTVRGDINELNWLVEHTPQERILSLGVIDGRNIWRSDLNTLLTWLKPIHDTLGERLWLAPSCSLLHVPVDLNSEHKLDPELKSWLAFAQQKLDELSLLKQGLNEGFSSIRLALESNQLAMRSRYRSTRVHNPAVAQRLQTINPTLLQRQSNYSKRVIQQHESLNLPLYPTTTIGSFPQTTEIRKARQAFKNRQISEERYQTLMQQEIRYAIAQQEQIGLDVLVHGEAERNDMVEYFGEQLDGYTFTQHGWVQSYGSRCVKPPIIYGDISRPQAMTVQWSRYAQSLTRKPMKGMLTGPITMLQWSFVRNDQSRRDTAFQIAFALRDEILDLEKAGIQVIQVDEPALREGLPLRQADWQTYLTWAVDAFRLSVAGVKDQTQIHTHMCYAEFNDIMPSIAALDADVITIETSRSDMELLDVFRDFHYPNEIGPGVYDIHSPNIPSTDNIVRLMQKASHLVPAQRLWINPDCGLKTRQWSEVTPALNHMVEAAHYLRTHANQTS